MKTLWVLAMSLSLPLAGCGDPVNAGFARRDITATYAQKAPDSTLRYDATNVETRLKSSQAMTAGMTPEEAEAFEADLMRHVKAYSGELDRRTPSDRNPNEDELMRPLHDLTASEIREKSLAEEREYRDANEAQRKAIAEGKLKRRELVQ